MCKKALCHPERKLARKRRLESKDLLAPRLCTKFQGKSGSFGFAQDDTTLLPDANYSIVLIHDTNPASALEHLLNLQHGLPIAYG